MFKSKYLSFALLIMTVVLFLVPIANASAQTLIWVYECIYDSSGQQVRCDWVVYAGRGNEGDPPDNIARNNDGGDITEDTRGDGDLPDIIVRDDEDATRADGGDDDAPPVIFWDLSGGNG